MRYSPMRARGKRMIRQDQPNRILIQASKMRIYLAQWEEVFEEGEASNRTPKISNQSSRIYSALISVVEEVEEDVIDNQMLKSYRKISVYYARSILMNQ